MKRCGARARHGGTCGKPAGWGTDHVGTGACKLHAGCVPAARVAAARRLAQALATEKNITADEALEWAVRASAGLVEAWTEEVRLLAEPILANGQPAFPVLAQQACIDQLVRASKVAKDAGVADRHVAALEQFGADIARSFQRLTDGLCDLLEANADQRRKARELVRGELSLLESSEAA